jgi:hypothetical protein
MEQVSVRASGTSGQTQMHGANVWECLRNVERYEKRVNRTIDPFDFWVGLCKNVVTKVKRECKALSQDLRLALQAHASHPRARGIRHRARVQDLQGSE